MVWSLHLVRGYFLSMPKIQILVNSSLEGWPSSLPDECLFVLLAAWDLDFPSAGVVCFLGRQTTYLPSLSLLTISLKWSKAWASSAVGVGEKTKATLHFPETLYEDISPIFHWNHFDYSGRVLAGLSPPSQHPA